MQSTIPAVGTSTDDVKRQEPDYPGEMSTEEKFLFDLRGFIVIRGVLEPSRVQRMRAEMDVKGIMNAANDPFKSRFSGFLEWGQDWAGLIDHPRILPILRSIIGEKFRLDHAYGMAMSADGQRGGEGLHHNAAMFDHGCFYTTHGARMHNGLVVVSYALCDVPAGAGGFCCVPGTHKTLYPLPPQWYGVLDNPLLEHVPMRAGDVVVFTEALSHGTMPWTCATHERRAALLKFAPAYMQWGSSPRVVGDGADLTPRQRAIASGPGVWDRPEVRSVG